MSSPARELERCVGGGGVAVFPSDTVYGLACAPDDPVAVERLYALKGRPPSKASAVMFFELEAALAAVSWLGERTREALTRLLPGAVTVLLPNPEGAFALACGEDRETLGLRVVSVPALAGVSLPVVQSSANLAGAPEARKLADVEASIRAGADLVIDGGELPGIASTVLDLRRFEQGGIDGVHVLRAGAVGDGEIALALSGQFHFDPATYPDLIREDIPCFDAFQEAVVAASGAGAGAGVDSILELGTGTGETASRLLARHPAASFVGIDESESMLGAARPALAPWERQVSLRVARLQNPLPPGPFSLVVSALCVHHLDPAEKADLFRRVAAVLVPGGRFVLGDVIVPVARVSAPISLTPGYDKPDSIADQLRWLSEAGFTAQTVWEREALAVITADGPG